MGTVERCTGDAVCGSRFDTTVVCRKRLEEPAPAPVGWLLGLSVAVAAVGVLVLGLWPAGVTAMAQVVLLP
ncbi:MAG: hypothetical protein ACE5HA_15650 [Anaerolineae bacterium]